MLSFKHLSRGMRPRALCSSVALVSLVVSPAAQAQLDRSAEIPSVIFDVGPEPQEAPVWVALGTDLSVVDAPASSIESLKEVFDYVASSTTSSSGTSKDCPESTPDHWGVRLGTFRSEVVRASWVAEVTVVGKAPGVFNTVELGTMLLLEIDHNVKGRSSGFDRLMFIPAIGTPEEAVCLRHPTTAGVPGVGDQLLLVVPDPGSGTGVLSSFSGAQHFEPHCPRQFIEV